MHNIFVILINQIDIKMKLNIKSLTILGLCSLLSSSVLAEGIVSESVEAERKFYIGGNLGYSLPAKSKFIDDLTKSKFTIKETPMYTGIIGYKITPDVMIEFTGEYKPSYPLGITLAKDDGGDKTNTKAQSQIFILNMVYHLAETKGLQPYFSIGAGISRIKVKSTGVPFDLNPAALEVTNTIASASGHPTFPSVDAFTALTGGISQAEKFRTNKYTANCFTWEVGLGVAKPISDNFQLNLGAKLQVAHNVKIKYHSLDAEATIINHLIKVASGAPSQTEPVYKRGEIKKTLGIVEATIGFTYDLPF